MTLSSSSSSSLRNCIICWKVSSFTIGLLWLISSSTTSGVAAFTTTLPPLSSSSLSSSSYYPIISTPRKRSQMWWSSIITASTRTTSTMAIMPLSKKTMWMALSSTRTPPPPPSSSRFLWLCSTTSSLRQTCLKSTPHGDNNNNNDNNVATTKAAVESLLGNVMGRAARTLSTHNDATTTNPSSPDNDYAYTSKNENEEKDSGVLPSPVKDDTTTPPPNSNNSSSTASPPSTNQNNPKDISNRTPYLENPAITLTALAKAQWSHIIRPHQDTVIDATCGNGNDSLAIAKMLFPPSDSEGNSQGKLICIDIQQTACENTKHQLQPYFENNNNKNNGIIPMDSHVEIRTASHSPLFPSTVDSDNHDDNRNVGLVCYNLGYLPSNTKGNDASSTTTTTFTQVSSTISSMADAALNLRVEGMLSVVTYPRTNPNEDYAVHAMLEGLGLLSSKSMDWRQYLQELGPDYQVSSTDTGETVKATATTIQEDTIATAGGGGVPDTGGNAAATVSYSVRNIVQKAVERVVEKGPVKQTWRVMEHKQMGRPLSPIFLTAIRIK